MVLKLVIKLISKLTAKIANKNRLCKPIGMNAIELEIAYKIAEAVADEKEWFWVNASVELDGGATAEISVRCHAYQFDEERIACEILEDTAYVMDADGEDLPDNLDFSYAAISDFLWAA